MARSGGRRPDRDAQRVLEALEAIVAKRRQRAARLPQRARNDAAPFEREEALPRHSGRLLGSMLVVRGFLVEPELRQVLALQEKTGERLGEILIRLGIIGERDLVELLAEQHKVRTIDLRTVLIDPAVAGLITKEHARALGALPLRRRDGRIDLAIADPTDADAIEFVASRCDAPVRVFLVRRADIHAALGLMSSLDASS
jgi:hypothetical protein